MPKILAITLGAAAVVALLLLAFMPFPDRCLSAEQRASGKRTATGSAAANLRRLGGSCNAPALQPAAAPAPKPQQPTCTSYRDLGKLSPTGNADDCAPANDTADPPTTTETAPEDCISDPAKIGEGPACVGKRSPYGTGAGNDGTCFGDGIIPHPCTEKDSNRPKP